MASETKLGLVVGGLFILCFAMILSNMDDEQALKSQVTAMKSTAQEEPTLTEKATQGRVDNSLVVYNPPKLEVETRSSQPVSPAETAINPKTEVTTLPSPGQEMVAQSSVGPNQRQSPPPTDLPPQSSVTDAINNRPLTADNHKMDHQKNVDMAKLDAMINSATPASNPSNTDAAPTEESTKRIHVVSAKETLSTIAKQYYGKATKLNVQRIYQANRNVLKSPDSLKVGQKLEIPADRSNEKNTDSTPADKVVLAKTNPSEAAEAMKEVAKPNSEKPKEDWLWYQVQKSDTLIKIARSQLGSDQRWREISELNKDIFPTPDQIRPGVRIKLPKK